MFKREPRHNLTLDEVIMIMVHILQPVSIIHLINCLDSIYDEQEIRGKVWVNIDEGKLSTNRNLDIVIA